MQSVRGQTQPSKGDRGVQTLLVLLTSTHATRTFCRGAHRGTDEKVSGERRESAVPRPDATLTLYGVIFYCACMPSEVLHVENLP